MKFKVNRDFLSNGLSQVVSIAGSNSRTNNIPVLNNVLIEASNGMLQFRTTNLDITISCSVKAEIIEEGKITLPVKKLNDIIKSLSNSDILIESSGMDKVRIISGSTKFDMVGISSDEFPKVALDISGEYIFEGNQNDILTMIRCVSNAQSTDQNRFVLNGVYFNFSEEQLELVATDGRRLSTVKLKLENKLEMPISFILPAKSVSELQSQLGVKGKIRLKLEGKQVYFEIDSEERENGFCGKIRIISKLIEGNYPQYKQVIPTDSENKIEIERNVLLEAVNLCQKVVSEKNYSILFNITNNQIEVHGSSIELGDASSLVIVKYEGPEVHIAFNPDYISDPLKSLTQDTVIFEFKNELSPGVLKSKDRSFLCVVMPQRK